MSNNYYSQKYNKLINNYIIRAPSKRKNKKYDVYDLQNHYLFSFGDSRFSQFRDSLLYYKDRDNNDPKRRALYYARHNKQYPDESPDTFSKVFLW